VATSLFTNATDKTFRLHFIGGYVEGPGGLLNIIWNKENFEGQVPTTKTFNVRSHDRQRVIGGATTTVAGHSVTRSYDFESAKRGLAATGRIVRVRLEDGSKWTLRVGGKLGAFKTFIKGAGAPQETVLFSTEKGTKISN
jgi:hypothetical protein